MPKEVLAGIALPLPRAERVFAQLLRVWPIPRFQGPWGELRLLFADVREVALPSRWATAVYLDPFSPRANPEAWSLPVLLKLRHSLKPGGRLATYSAQGAFRRAFGRRALPCTGCRGWGSGSGRWV